MKTEDTEQEEYSWLKPAFNRDQFAPPVGSSWWLQALFKIKMTAIMEIMAGVDYACYYYDRIPNDWFWKLLGRLTGVGVAFSIIHWVLHTLLPFLHASPVEEFLVVIPIGLAFRPFNKSVAEMITQNSEDE